MPELVADCPRCGASQITFDLTGQGVPGVLCICARFRNVFGFISMRYDTTKIVHPS